MVSAATPKTVGISSLHNAKSPTVSGRFFTASQDGLVVSPPKGSKPVIKSFLMAFTPFVPLYNVAAELARGTKTRERFAPGGYGSFSAFYYDAASIVIVHLTLSSAFISKYPPLRGPLKGCIFSSDNLLENKLSIQYATSSPLERFK